MRIWIVLVLTIFVWSFSSRAVRDGFASIDGKNYYDFLGVQQTSTAAEIKSAYRNLMLQFHPDRAGEKGEAMTKKLNEAYDALKDAAKRKRYDSWLTTGTSSDSARSSSSQMDEEEYINNQIRSTAQFVAEKAYEQRRQYPNSDFIDMANAGRFHVVYFVRFMPSSSYRAQDLYRFVWDEGVKAYSEGKISQDGLAMLAGGALTYLTELATYDRSGTYRTFLDRVQRMLMPRLEAYASDHRRRQIFDDLWKITTNRRSFYPPPPPPAPPRSANSCEATLVGRVTKDGVTYEIPITISIKIGL